jgi:hypothetical protein
MTQIWMDNKLSDAVRLVGTYDDDSGHVLLVVRDGDEEYIVKDKVISANEDVTLDQIRSHFRKLTHRISSKQGATLDLWLNALKKKS